MALGMTTLPSLPKHNAFQLVLAIVVCTFLFLNLRTLLKSSPAAPLTSDPIPSISVSPPEQTLRESNLSDYRPSPATRQTHAISLSPAPPTPHYLSICSVFKDEAEYLDEWIHFHHIIGVQRFYLYNHNSTDESVEVLQPYVDAGWVVLNDARDYYDETLKLSMSQVANYQHCLTNYGKDTRWMMFIDVDEFAFSPEAETLSSVLKDYEKYPGVIMRNVFFGSSGHIAKPSGTVIENYLYRSPVTGFKTGVDDVLYHVKSIVDPSRAETCPLNWQRTCSHFFCYKGLDKLYTPLDPTKADDETLFPVNEKFERQTKPTTRGGPYISRIRYNHYKGKSYEDYTLGKMVKGTVQGLPAMDKFAKRGNHWSQVDLNEIRDDAILRFLPALKKSLGVQDERGIRNPPLLTATHSTNNKILMLQSNPDKPSASAEQAIAFVVGAPGSATSFLADMLRAMAVPTVKNQLALKQAHRSLLRTQTPSFLGSGFDAATVSGDDLIAFKKSVTPFINMLTTSPDPQLSNSTFSFIYEARLPLLLPLWRKYSNPHPSFCIFVNSDPSMLASYYSGGYPVNRTSYSDASAITSEGLVQEWDRFSLAAISGCSGLPVILVSEGELLTNPFNALLRLHLDLVKVVGEGSVGRLGVFPLSREYVSKAIEMWCYYTRTQDPFFCQNVDKESVIDWHRGMHVLTNPPARPNDVPSRIQTFYQNLEYLGPFAVNDETTTLEREGKTPREELEDEEDDEEEKEEKIAKPKGPKGQKKEKKEKKVKIDVQIGRAHV